MWCAIYKWRISRSLDSRKPPNRLTKAHLATCASCREYARFMEDLGRRLSQDAAAVIESAGTSLANKTSAALARRGRSPSLSRLRRIPLKPALAAAVTLSAIGIAVFWMVASRSTNIPPLDPLFELTPPQARLADAALKAESPLHQEMKEWKQAFTSAAAYLMARLDIQLGE